MVTAIKTTGADAPVDFLLLFARTSLTSSDGRPRISGHPGLDRLSVVRLGTDILYPLPDRRTPLAKLTDFLS